MNTFTSFEDDVVTAAGEAATLVPAPSPLRTGATIGLSSLSVPDDAVAVAADVRGSRPGRVVVIVRPQLATVLAESPMGPLPLTEVLRPALESLAAALGVAALGPVTAAAAGAALALLDGDESAVVPLADDDGEAAAWLVVSASSAPPPAAASGVPAPGMHMLQDVVMELTAELGRTSMTVRDLLNLQPGAVVELDRLAGSPADLLVNGRLIARGEVVVVDEYYALKIIELLSGPTGRD